MADKSPPAVCSYCGTMAPDGAPGTWSSELNERGLMLVCDTCTRSNLRSIEGRLDQGWW